MSSVVNPLVSVRFMVYNNEAFIREAIESILMQKTSFNVEIVVGDDFSTDNTLNIIKEYSDTNNIYFNILNRQVEDEYWKERKRLGRLYNFTNIVENCSGKYIALLDGDDYWTDPLKLQKQVDFLEGNPDYGICFHSVKLYNQETKEFLDDTITRSVDETTEISKLAKGNYIHSPSVMLRYDFTIPDWFIESPIGDWTLYMLVIKDKKIKKLDEEMAVYRVHSSSIWSGLSQEIRNKKTRKSVKLIADNLILPMDISQIINSRLSIKKKNKSLIYKINKELKKIIRKK